MEVMMQAGDFCIDTNEKASVPVSPFASDPFSRAMKFLKKTNNKNMEF